MEEEVEQLPVISEIDINKQQIYKMLDKMEQLLEVQEDMNDKQEKQILLRLKSQFLGFKQHESDMIEEGSSLIECQTKSMQLLENIYYIINKIDQKFTNIIGRLEQKPAGSQFKKNNELDLIVNKLLLESLNENMESSGQLIDDSYYIHKIEPL